MVNRYASRKSGVFGGILLIIFVMIATVVAQNGPVKHVGEKNLSAAAYIHKLLRAGKLQIPAVSEAPGQVFTPTTPLQPLLASPNMIGNVTIAVDYDQNATLNNGSATIPPDPTCAVGPNHFLNVVNVTVEWYRKDRTREYQANLDEFFAPTSPTYGLFDAWALYDQYENRYVIMAVEQDDNNEASFLHIAVSDDDDPNGTWYYQKWDAVVLFGTTKTWPDYPKMGVGPQALYITGNMFGFSSGYQGTRLWIVDKGVGTGGVYDGGTSTVAVYDPSTLAGLTDQAFTLQPAHMYGTPSGTTDNYLFSTEWSDGTNDDLILIMRVDDPLGNSGGPNFYAKFVNPGEIHNNSVGVPDAPQKDDPDHDLDSGDDRAMFCVWRDNYLWGAFTTNPSSGTDAGQATAFWFRVNTTDWNALNLDASSHIGGEDIAAGTYTFYPAIFPNKDNDAVVVFSGSGPNINPGAYYALIKNGTLQASEELKAGEDSYFRTFLAGLGRNRWGDYGGAAIDPVDELTFWLYHEYALPRATPDVFGEYGRWGTAFAHVGTIESPTYFYADNITVSSLVLHWNGRSAEFKVTQNGSVIFTGTDTTLTVNGLTENTTYQFVVRGKSSGENYFSADSIVLSVTTEPAAGSTNPTEVASATPTYSTGSGTSEFAIRQSGVWLTFPGGTSQSTQFTAYKNSGDPGVVGSLPATVDRIAKDRNWTVVASAGTSVGTYNIRFDLTGVSGITNFNTLRILKRDNSSSAWQDVETDLGATVTYNEPYITVSGLTTLSDFAIGASGSDNPLPVMLSSFTARGGNQQVLLQWRTESEFNNLGFIIERSLSKDGPFSEIASYQNYPQLAGQGNSNQPHQYQFTDLQVENNKTYYYRLVDVDVNGWKTYHNVVSATPNVNGVDMEKEDRIATKFDLFQNYPNPFNPSTTISFSVPSSQRDVVPVQLIIYNNLGQAVRHLFEGELDGGFYKVRWDGKDDAGQTLPSGIYYVQFRTPVLQKTQRMLLMK